MPNTLFLLTLNGKYYFEQITMKQLISIFKCRLLEQANTQNIVSSSQGIFLDNLLKTVFYDSQKDIHN